MDGFWWMIVGFVAGWHLRYWAIKPQIAKISRLVDGLVARAKELEARAKERPGGGDPRA